MSSRLGNLLSNCHGDCVFRDETILLSENLMFDE